MYVILSGLAAIFNYLRKMLIKIDHITEKGLHLKVQKGASWVTNISEIVNGTADLSLNKDIEIDCNVTKIQKGISISGLMQFGIKTICYRCLKEVKLNLKTDIYLILTPEHEFESDQVDIRHDSYEGESVDLSDYFREQIAMNLPSRVVCKDICEGLCSECGADLNVERCNCQKSLNNSAFTVLKNIKFENNFGRT